MSHKYLRQSTFSAIMVTAALCAAGHAQAGVSITSAGNGGIPTGSSITVLNFDTTPLGNATRTFTVSGISATMSFTGDGGIVNGSASGIYAMPYPSLAGPDTTNYASTGIGSVSFAFSTPQDYFGLLWGSVDTYNTLSFYDAGGHLISAFTGADVTASANGDQGFLGTYYVNFGSDTPFTKVVASSTSYAFEFDNVAFDPPAVPEPFSLSLVGMGAAIFAVMKRRGLLN